MKRGTTMSHQERVLRMLVTIESDLSADLSLEALAAREALSPYHLHRVFRALVGEPLKEYVRRLRLERAAGELAAGTRPIVDIALDAGYETHESFTRAFRDARGVSPSEYRAARHQEWAGAKRAVSRGDQPRRARVEPLPVLRVAFIRHVGPYEEVTPVFTRLSEWVRARQPGLADLMWIGVPHDNPMITPADRLRFDCCVMGTGDVTPEGEIGVREIGGELYATTTHYGAFEGLAATYGWLGGEFIPSAALVLRAAPAIEIYLTNPETTAPEDLLTDILLPVEKIARR